MIEVIQADREAAAKFFGYDDWQDVCAWSEQVHVWPLIDLLARHRIASQEAAIRAAKVEASRVQAIDLAGLAAVPIAEEILALSVEQIMQGMGE